MSQGQLWQNGCMGAWVAVQAAAVWLLLAGAVVLAFALIAYHRIERVPRALNIALFWVAGVLLALGVLAFIAPYLIIFFGARAI
jgi:drug/metabolite transporter (DMT)-like permease